MLAGRHVAKLLGAGFAWVIPTPAEFRLYSPLALCGRLGISPAEIFVQL